MAERKKLSDIKKAKQLQPDSISKKPLADKARKLSPERQERLNNMLLDAAKDGKIKRVERLLKAGADVNAKLAKEKEDYQGNTALMRAARNGHTEIAKLLIENKAKINAKDRDGWTALMTAVAFENKDIAKILVESGADVNVKAENGEYTGISPLIMAAKYEDSEICRLLLENGANVSVTYGKGITAISQALDRKRPETARLIVRYLMKSFFLDQRADIFMSKFRECTR